MNTEYIIVSDDDGHHYVIPFDKLSEWHRWLDSESCVAPAWSEDTCGEIMLLRWLIKSEV